MLLNVAWADYQVAVVTADVMARTMGVGVRVPALEPGQHLDVAPYWGIDTLDTFPHIGSAMIIWDSGNPAPPAPHVRQDSNQAGFSDPHERPRVQTEARVQKSEFMKPGGLVVDGCDIGPCLAP